MNLLRMECAINVVKFIQNVIDVLVDRNALIALIIFT